MFLGSGGGNGRDRMEIKGYQNAWFTCARSGKTKWPMGNQDTMSGLSYYSFME